MQIRFAKSAFEDFTGYQGILHSTRHSPCRRKFDLVTAMLQHMELLPPPDAGRIRA